MAADRNVSNKVDVRTATGLHPRYDAGRHGKGARDVLRRCLVGCREARDDQEGPGSQSTGWHLTHGVASSAKGCAARCRSPTIPREIGAVNHSELRLEG